MNTKEIFILGAGAGGTKVATELRLMGFEGKIRIIEDRFLGGECTNLGCIPSKSLYNIAKLYTKTRKILKQEIPVDTKVISDNVRRAVNTIRKGIEYNLKNADIEVLYSKAIVKKDKIVIDNKEYNFDVLVVATGSSPVNFFYDNPYVLTNRDLWGPRFQEFIDEINKGKKVLVIGGGYIGIETASIFSSIFTNSSFTIMEKENTILPMADDEIISEIQKILLKSGIRIISGVTIKQLTVENGKVLVKYTSAYKEEKEEFDFVIMSAGRKINNPLEDVKLEVDEFLRVKGYENVWAVGDVTGGKMLAHKAEFQAKTVAKNIINYLQGKEISQKYTLTNEIQMPSIMFSIPEVGWYGLTEKQVKRMGLDYIVKRENLAGNPRAIADNSREGFVKIIYNNKGEILGVHILADNVSELINIPMAYNSQTVVFSHPTLAEVFNELI
ncbi:MAG: dihydrolipoyl dehydrogenase family protein [bacterium]